MPDEKPPPLAAAEALIASTEGDVFTLDTPFEQIVHGTFMRSRDTFQATYNLLATGFPVQAAMLVRSLFEDVIVAHWLVLNEGDDRDWLTGRFRRHRDAMALYQDQLRRETGWDLGRPVADASTLRSKQNALRKEFGGDARRDWWDPRANGDGTGDPLGLEGIAKKLEDSAAAGGLFRIRFAGGAEPLLARMEKVAHKWLTQFLHHTALGLPFGMTEAGEPEALNDPSDIVAFTAYWMFAQQIYLLHDVHGRDQSAFNEVFKAGLIGGFSHLGADPDLILDVPPEPPSDEEDAEA